MRNERRARALRLLAGSLAALGGCGWGAVPMYGVEIPEYSFHGHVVDAETGGPIEGIRVRFGGDEQYTDADGAWELTGGAPQDCEPGSCYVEALDVDGAVNGSYQAAEAELLRDDHLSADATDIIVEMVPEGDTGLD